MNSLIENMNRVTQLLLLLGPHSYYTARATEYGYAIQGSFTKRRESVLLNRGFVLKSCEDGQLFTYVNEEMRGAEVVLVRRKRG